MKTRIRVAMVALVGLLCCAAQANAQSSGLFGSRSIGGGVQEGARSFSGTPGNQVQQAQADAGQVSGQERFLRDNRQPGQFVGADSGDTQNFFSQFGAGGGQGLSGLANRATNRRQTTGNSANRAIPYRAQLSIGFPVPSSAASAGLENLERRFVNLERQKRLPAINVEREGSTLVLRGRVANEQDRDLAIQLARLEPGFADVRSELVVASETPPTDSPADDSPVESAP